MIPAHVLWVGVGVLFLLYEVYAAVTRTKGGTLSENVWDAFGVKTPRPYSPARRAVLAAFLCTLTAHLVFGEPGGLWIVITGAPVSLVIAYSVMFDARPSRSNVRVELSADTGDFMREMSTVQSLIAPFCRKPSAKAEHSEHIRADAEAGAESREANRQRIVDYWRAAWARSDAKAAGKKGGQ
jgi:hypothetical protein